MRSTTELRRRKGEARGYSERRRPRKAKSVDVAGTAIDHRAMSKAETDAKAPPPVNAKREARLAQALRDNLKRRKSAGRPDGGAQQD
jgi:hypothetical protein